MTGLNHHQHELNSCWMCLLPQKLGFACEEEESAGSSPPCYKLDVDVMCRAAKRLGFFPSKQHQTSQLQLGRMMRFAMGG